MKLKGGFVTQEMNCYPQAQYGTVCQQKNTSQIKKQVREGDSKTVTWRPGIIKCPGCAGPILCKEEKHTEKYTAPSYRLPALSSDSSFLVYSTFTLVNHNKGETEIKAQVGNQTQV